MQGGSQSPCSTRQRHCNCFVTTSEITAKFYRLAGARPPGPGFSVLLFGGNANNGTNDGFYANWNNTAGNSNWNIGGRPPLLVLEFMKHQRLQALPLGKNNCRLYAQVYGSGTRRSRFNLETPCRQERTREMPKRYGNLWERFVAEDNCILAEKIMAKNKSDNRMARYIGEHADYYGKAMQEKLVSGEYIFSIPRETTISDSYKGKTRPLQIPCLEDQAVMQAWLNIATPYIERVNYFYNCGSIPKAGQTRAVNGLKRMLGRAKPPKWAAVTDIRKFYETCPHKAVIAGLRRLFKDERFIDIAKKMMDSMSSTGVGLAIGYPVSHWFANVALMYLDLQLRREFPDVLHFRYMDDTVFVSRNKRHLRRALKFYIEQVKRLGMTVKRNWQVFPIKKRGITFLSYRFFPGYTLLTKPLMYRIARKMKRAAENMTVHAAQGVMSYIGILKHCDSHNFMVSRVYPYIIPKKCRKVISIAAKNLLLTAA